MSAVTVAQLQGVAIAVVLILMCLVLYAIFEKLELDYQAQCDLPSHPKPEMLVSFWGVRCYFRADGEGCDLWGETWLMDRLIPLAGTLDLIACRLTGREAFAFVVLEEL